MIDQQIYFCYLSILFDCENSSIINCPHAIPIFCLLEALLIGILTDNYEIFLTIKYNEIRVRFFQHLKYRYFQIEAILKWRHTFWLGVKGSLTKAIIEHIEVKQNDVIIVNGKNLTLCDVI
jgi:hypothetical protein